MYVPERRAAGLQAPPFEAVGEEMRARSQQRVFDEEVARWMQELRTRSRVAVYRIPLEVPPDRTPVLLATAPPAKLTPVPTPAAP